MIAQCGSVCVHFTSPDYDPNKLIMPSSSQNLPTKRI